MHKFYLKTYNYTVPTIKVTTIKEGLKDMKYYRRIIEDLLHISGTLHYTQVKTMLGAIPSSDKLNLGLAHGVRKQTIINLGNGYFKIR